MGEPRGIVLTAAEVAHEGVDTVLDTIAGVGANAVSVFPGSFVLASPNEGVREPPLDIEGSNRILDRPLWGRRVRYVKGYSSYLPDPEVWRDVPFPPPPVRPTGDTPANAGPREDLAAAVIRGARDRGLDPYVAISPTLLPGLPGGQSLSSGRDEPVAQDRLVRVDGSTPTRAIAGQGCVNNPRIQALARARVTETLLHYREASGVFIDWVEYTCYLPEDIFCCFCPHCARTAEQAGLDWDAIRRGVMELFTGLQDLCDADLDRVVAERPASIVDALAVLTRSSDAARSAGHELMRFKARSVTAYFASVRELADRLGVPIEIGANAFCAPWNVVTGADIPTLTDVVDVVRCKLFTFHWPMMTRWLCQWLMELSPALTPQRVLQAAQVIYDVPAPADDHRSRVSDFQMPEPDEPHPITMSALADKLTRAVAGTGPRARTEAYLHSYRPVAEFERLLDATSGIAAGTWIQRYGYLSDDKLAVLRNAWSGAGESETREHR